MEEEDTSMEDVETVDTDTQDSVVDTVDAAQDVDTDTEHSYNRMNEVETFSPNFRLALTGQSKFIYALSVQIPN